MTPRGQARTDLGHKRERNDDQTLVDDALGLYVVCDGLSGHHGGHRAAELAIDAISGAVAAEAPTFAQLQGEALEARLEKTLADAFRHACQEIFEEANRVRSFGGMGCSATAVLVYGDRAVRAHVGASRLYLIRNRKPYLLTRDHSIAYELVESGRMEPGNPRLDDFERVLTRSLGTFRTVMVDTAPIFLETGDLLAICSNGAWTGPGGTQRLAGVLANSRPNDLAKRVIHQANEAGGDDNTSVVTITFEGEVTSPELDLLPSELVPLLQSTPLFRGLSHRQVGLVLAAGRHETYPDGNAVVDVGQRLDEILVVLDGRLLRGSDRLERGELFAIGAFHSEARKAKLPIPANGQAKVLHISHREFRALAQSQARLGLALYQNLVRLAAKLPLDEPN